jgi:hypothetical protein
VVAIQTGNDQESRLVGHTRELPHGASEQILEAPDEVVRVDARAVVRLACDELMRGVDARQAENVRTPGRGLAVSGERRSAGDHRFRERV